jgi:hypothetical protein
MKKYTFGVWLDIDAENDEDAVLFFDEVMKHSFISDSYCFEYKEIE